jgi:hypothetical protein
MLPEAGGSAQITLQQCSTDCSRAQLSREAFSALIHKQRIGLETNNPVALLQIELSIFTSVHSDVVDQISMF